MICLTSSEGRSANLQYVAKYGREHTAMCHCFNSNNHFELFSLAGTQHFSSSRILENNGRNLLRKHAHTHELDWLMSAWEVPSFILCITTLPLRFSSFKKSHLISYWPMKLWRVRGKWTINLCNVIPGLSTVSKCLHRHPSKTAVKRILQKRNLSRAGLSLYLPPARQQQGIKHIIFQRSVHFSYRLSFYVLCTPAQGRTAVWAPHPL